MKTAASHWSYITWFTILRVYTGLFWLSHGVPKFLHSARFMPPNGFMVQMVTNAANTQSGLYHTYLTSIVLPNITLFANLDRLAEVLVGLSLFFGIFTRLGGLVGCFMALNYFALQGEFGHWSAIGSIEVVAFMLSFLMLAVPAGRVAGVDALMIRPVASREEHVVPEIVEEPPLTPPTRTNP